MIPLTKSLLDRSPEETARQLCLGRLEDAAGALERLEHGKDREALHDFRVALRRLRSHLRAYRPYLSGSKPKKLRSKIGALASSTNAARDAEVSIEWLSKEAGKHGPAAEAGARLLLEILRSSETEAPSPATLRAGFDPLRERAAKALSHVELRLGEQPTSFLAATGKLLVRMSESLARHLASIESVEDGDELHRARIEAKRLRYLLEPLKLEVPGTASLVESMKSLQDCLGELQDTRVLIDCITSTLERSALDEARRLAEAALGEAESKELPEPRPHPGLLELLAVQRQRRERRFEELSNQWLGESGRAFFAELESFGERFSSPTPEDGRVRRFLLRERPKGLERSSGTLIRQGWLPGKEVREDVRSEAAGRRVRRIRTVSVAGRAPVQESLSRSRFEAFWTLTQRRRLERRRHRLAVDGHVWYVDEILERGLVLAEVAANGGDTVPEPIRDVLVREVTGSKKYAPEALAGPSTANQDISLGS